MAIQYGVTPQGYVLKPQSVFLSDFERLQRGTIASDEDLDPDQALGQVNGIFSRACAELHELGQALHAAFDPDAAEDTSLDTVCKITGTPRAAATFSIVLCTLGITTASSGSPCTITAGLNFAQVVSDPTTRFTPEVDFVATAPGTYTDIRFKAENAGAVVAAAGSLTVIATAVVGWDTVINPTDADLGAPVWNDATLRIHREEDLAKSGSATTDAIVAAVDSDPRLVDPLTGRLIFSVDAFENQDGAIDGNGLPPHSFEVLVDDGGSPPPGNADLIAQVIWEKKPSGIRPFGALVGAALDRKGATQFVAFSRVTRRPVALIYELTPGPNYVTDAKLALFIASQAKFLFPTGQSVDAIRALGIPYDAVDLTDDVIVALGVKKIVSLKLGFVADGTPTNFADLPIATRELATFDTSHITLTHV